MKYNETNSVYMVPVEYFSRFKSNINALIIRFKSDYMKEYKICLLDDKKSVEKSFFYSFSIPKSNKKYSTEFIVSMPITMDNLQSDGKGEFIIKQAENEIYHLCVFDITGLHEFLTIITHTAMKVIGKHGDLCKYMNHLSLVNLCDLQEAFESFSQTVEKLPKGEIHFYRMKSTSNEIIYSYNILSDTLDLIITSITTKRYSDTFSSLEDFNKFIHIMDSAIDNTSKKNKISIS